MIYNEKLRTLFQIAGIDEDTAFSGYLGAYDQQQAEAYLNKIENDAYNDGEQYQATENEDAIDDAVEEGREEGAEAILDSLVDFVDELDNKFKENEIQVDEETLKKIQNLFIDWKREYCY